MHYPVTIRGYLVSTAGCSDLDATFEINFVTAVFPPLDDARQYAFVVFTYDGLEDADTDELNAAPIVLLCRGPLAEGYFMCRLST